MAIPEERTRALLQTEQFLQELTLPHKTPNVPQDVRDEAFRLLRHFPDEATVKSFGRLLPLYFAMVDEAPRFHAKRRPEQLPNST